MSSKCKRLNKTTTNHYHDSGSHQLIDSSRALNSTCSSSSIKHQHHHIHLREPPLLAKEDRQQLLVRNHKNNNRKMELGKIKGKRQLIVKMRQQQATQKGSLNANNSKLLAFLSTSSILITLTLLLLLLLSVTNEVESLNCFTCSSADNPGCDEAFTGRANFTNPDCESQIGKPAKVCRKLVQYIENKKVVIRSCGYIDEHVENERKPMCYKRSGTFAIMMESCICYEDLCNHSASLVPNNQIITLTLSGLVSLVLIYIFKY